MFETEREMKSFAVAVAAEVQRESRAMSLIRRLHRLAGTGGSPISGPLSPSPEGRRVGIWEAREDGTYERTRAGRAEWQMWAEVERIPPRDSRTRVVFLGESVGRGTFYDPAVNPAGMLQTMLHSVILPNDVEVVDLARNNLSLDGLRVLASECMALRPDACVIFAGNNWSPTSQVLLGSGANPIESRDARSAEWAISALRAGGIAELKGLLERILQQRTAALLEQLTAMAQRIPLVVVIPEFNLADWRCVLSAGVPSSGSSGLERWHELRARAVETLHLGQLELSEQCASEMSDIDGGTTGEGSTLLADCALRRGHVERARALLERARDARIWDIGPTSPRAFSMVQRMLRTLRHRAGITVVDLPEVFRQHLGGALPDRRVFLDYCHLTSRGMRVAMAEVAAALHLQLAGKAIAASDLAVAVQVEPAVEAEAFLGAALHNAHLGQRREIVRWFCESALAAAPEVAAPFMKRFAHLQMQRTPVWMCQAFLEIRDHARHGLKKYSSPYAYGAYQVFDEVVLDEMAGALEALEPGARERLREARIAQRSVRAGRPVDLLDPYYAPWDGHREASWRLLAERGLARCNFFRAYLLEFSFTFVARGDEPLVLTMTCRRFPRHAADAPCAITINGVPHGELNLGGRWRTFTVPVAAQCLNAGVNRVVIRWPPPANQDQEERERLAADVADGLLPFFLPVLGEIASFTAAASGERDRTAGAPMSEIAAK
jgi:hypothetical protein